MFIFAAISAAFAIAPAITRFASASVSVIPVTPHFIAAKVNGAAYRGFTVQ
jgi:hypothetical protein